MTNLIRHEMETIVNYNAGEQGAIVYTRDKAIMRKLDQFAADYLEIYKLVKQTDIDKTYSIPKSYISYRKLRAVSADQREKAKRRIEKLSSGGNSRRK